MKRTSSARVALLLIGFAPAASAQDTAVAARPDTTYVEYSESPISFPLGVGLRIPTYDRVNGLTLPWGPKIETSNGRIDVDALVRYRSHLGDWDPSVEGVMRPGDGNELRLFVGRGTFTNDEWIRGDLLNSAAALVVGSDARNYYRADKATARFSRAFAKGSALVTPFISANYERDWSTGSVAPTKSPWSVFGRSGLLRMRRPNPPIDRGHIASAIIGSALELTKDNLNAKLNLTLEQSVNTAYDSACVSTPGGTLCRQPGQAFTQAVFHGTVKFPTVGSQTFSFTGHGMWTPGAGPAPAQRFAYLGGSGTLATVHLLALGGDRLLYVQGDYMIPIEKINLPLTGNPFVAVRYAAGNAGVGSLPALIQNIGIGLGASVLRVDFTVDPARNRSPLSHRSAVTFGVDLAL